MKWGSVCVERAIVNMEERVTIENWHRDNQYICKMLVAMT